MRSADDVVVEIVRRLKEQGYAQVRGYNRFGYISQRNTSLVLSREKGKDTPISFAKIKAAVLAVRDDPTIYDRGPGSLRSHGITHVNSPLWALLHLLPIDRIITRL